MKNIEFIELCTKAISQFILPDNIALVKEVLFNLVCDKEIREINDFKPKDNESALNLFISSKNVEGCSSKSLKYYRTTLISLLVKINKPYYLIVTEDIRIYLADYQEKNNIGKVTIDNIRRIISTFFSWLEAEDYIMKSPERRIHKVRTGKPVKEVYSEETVELIRQNVSNIRDLAIIDLLYSTGMRVGELVKINIKDVDFENRECIVLGKGNKQRKVYFDAKTKIHIKQYLETRKDNNDALFVSLMKPYNRLEISGVEIALRKIGNKLGIKKVHPHKFRRTLATKAIDKGMPIEQVQHMLGHTKIDTTLEYALVDDSNVKLSHKKYLE